MNYLNKIDEQESWRRYWISGLLQEKEYQTEKTQRFQGSEIKRKKSPFRFNLKSTNELKRPHSLTFKTFNRTRKAPNQKFSELMFGKETAFLMPSRNKTLQSPQAMSLEGFNKRKRNKYKKIGGAEKKNNFWISRDIISRTETNIQDVTVVRNNGSKLVGDGQQAKIGPRRYLTRHAGNPFRDRKRPKRYDTLQ